MGQASTPDVLRYISVATLVPWYRSKSTRYLRYVFLDTLAITNITSKGRHSFMCTRTQNIWVIFRYVNIWITALPYVFNYFRLGFEKGCEGACVEDIPLLLSMPPSYLFPRVPSCSSWFLLKLMIDYVWRLFGCVHQVR